MNEKVDYDFLLQTMCGAVLDFLEKDGIELDYRDVIITDKNIKYNLSNPKDLTQKQHHLLQLLSYIIKAGAENAQDKYKPEYSLAIGDYLVNNLINTEDENPNNKNYLSDENSYATLLIAYYLVSMSLADVIDGKKLNVNVKDVAPKLKIDTSKENKFNLY